MPSFPGLPPDPTPRERKAHRRRFDLWVAQERSRIRTQRAAFASSRGPSRRRLMVAMLDRAWALLEAGECEAADALLEFVPEAEATRLLDEFFPD